MSVRIDAVLRVGVLCNRSWPFATPPSQLRHSDLLKIEARMLAMFPPAPDAGFEDEI